MSVIGIIAEYNPFHNGHRHQLAQIRRLTPNANLVAVMSGNFTQRGTAAIADKWQRAQLAVENGIDLVIENPFVGNVRSAQKFAESGITILKSLGVVDQLAFGSEYTNLLQLQQIAAGSETVAVQELLHTYIQQGDSYAAALEQVITQKYRIDSAAIRQPNTILALEYIKALRHIAPEITPLLLPRQSAAYHDTRLSAGISSATAIRTALHTPSPDFPQLQQTMPANVYTRLEEQYRQHELPDENLLFRPLLLQCINHSAAEIKTFYGINEGMEYKLLASIKKATSLNDLRRLIQNKRYPGSRIQRLFLYILLNISAAKMEQFDRTGPLYCRILAFNEQGRLLLHAIKQKASLPLITKPSDFLSSHQYQHHPLTLAQQMFAIDTQATDVYSLCFASPTQRQKMDFITSPAYVKA